MKGYFYKTITGSGENLHFHVMVNAVHCPLLFLWIIQLLKFLSYYQLR